jgi:D-glycero-alpha-D-manno-heptose-7-phosphate kinase
MHIGVSPVRISFAGGGTDLPEYYNSFNGCVLGTTINKFTYVMIHPRSDETFQSFSPDFQKHSKPKKLDKIEIEDGTEISSAIIKSLNYKKGLDIIMCSDVPGGSGLGASSSLAVNLINTLNFTNGKKLQPKKIAETAFEIERNVLNWPMGKQDEYLTAFGGLNFFKFSKNRVSSKNINITKQTQSELQNNLLLFFVGTTRKSSSILQKQIKRITTKNQQTLDSLHFVKNLADSLFTSLNNSDITKFGELLHDGWIAKKNFSPNVSNQKIDKIYKYALKHGALGGKLTGAGGGGHLLLYVEKRKQKSIIPKMEKIGLTNIPFLFHQKGPQIFNLHQFLGKDNVKI